MANEQPKKCAHLYLCVRPTSGREVLQPVVKEAGPGEAEIARDCGRPACTR